VCKRAVSQLYPSSSSSGAETGATLKSLRVRSACWRGPRLVVYALDASLPLLRYSRVVISKQVTAQRRQHRRGDCPSHQRRLHAPAMLDALQQLWHRQPMRQHIGRSRQQPTSARPEGYKALSTGRGHAQPAKLSENLLEQLYAQHTPTVSLIDPRPFTSFYVRFRTSAAVRALQPWHSLWLELSQRRLRRPADAASVPFCRIVRPLSCTSSLNAYSLLLEVHAVHRGSTRHMGAGGLLCLTRETSVCLCPSTWVCPYSGVLMLRRDLAGTQVLSACSLVGRPQLAQRLRTAPTGAAQQVCLAPCR
jgi:hypothetical protein